MNTVEDDGLSMDVICYIFEFCANICSKNSAIQTILTEYNKYHDDMKRFLLTKFHVNKNTCVTRPWVNRLIVEKEFWCHEDNNFEDLAKTFPNVKYIGIEYSYSDDEDLHRFENCYIYSFDCFKSLETIEFYDEVDFSYDEEDDSYYGHSTLFNLITVDCPVPINVKNFIIPKYEFDNYDYQDYAFTYDCTCKCHEICDWLGYEIYDRLKSRVCGYPEYRINVNGSWEGCICGCPERPTNLPYLYYYWKDKSHA
uniref:Uncharacterized protein n=1 Tax=Mimivirus LCMiAC01 TaxID=2506608 RepID=A0A481Z032_9VIRU|nr:MAG: hypothetical protein LCMiAC01_02880 [Mimivirus LCMiAC01]